MTVTIGSFAKRQDGLGFRTDVGRVFPGHLGRFPNGTIDLNTGFWTGSSFGAYAGPSAATVLERHLQSSNDFIHRQCGAGLRCELVRHGGVLSMRCKRITSLVTLVQRRYFRGKTLSGDCRRLALGLVSRWPDVAFCSRVRSERRRYRPCECGTMTSTPARPMFPARSFATTVTR
jgi:hypothetical protein